MGKTDAMSATERLYYADPFLLQFTARVIASTGADVAGAASIL